MANTKVCRICGATYSACKTPKPKNVAFRWQDVACCAEHGEEYLARILESRKPAVAPVEPVKEELVVEPVVEDVVEDIIEDENEDEVEEVEPPVETEEDGFFIG